MITKRLILALLIVISAITVSCKKYPDGPLISFRTAKGRLYGGHTIVKYTVNGVDSLKQYCDSCSSDFEFYKNKDTGNDYCEMDGNRSDGKGSLLHWIWELDDKNKVLKVTATGFAQGECGTGPFKSNVLPEWQILKLEKKEVIMQTTYNGKVYLIELKRND